MTNMYIRLISLLPRVNQEAVKQIEATAQFLSVAVPQTVISNSREIAVPRNLTIAPMAR